MPSETEAGFRGAATAAGADPDEEDHYSLLGVTFSATHAEITQAYRRAMKRTHPDRVHPSRRAEAEAHARRLNAAYAVLRDPVKRQAYDRTIRQQVIQDQIMRQYVGGFQTFDEPGRRSPHTRREMTPAERRQRSEADRRAWITLLLVAATLTAIIVIGVVLSALLGGLLETAR